MFTGITEELGKIRSVLHGSNSIKLSICCDTVLENTKIGDSIAVNGICLTVTEMGKDWFAADVMPETLRKTSLSKLETSSMVNLERALRLSDRLGGHIVSGHIDGTGTIVNIKKEDNAIWYSVSVNESVLKYIVMKGSVAIDGTSLTVAYVDDSCFKVSIIPHTSKVTIIGTKKVGDIVNVECDVIGKYIEKLISGNTKDKVGKSGGISMEFLSENGFA